MAKQIKIFSSIEPSDLEKQVNSWLLDLSGRRELLQMNSHTEIDEHKAGFVLNIRYTIICLYEDGI